MTQRQVLAFFKIILYVCVCVGGGGVSSDFFHFPKFQEAPTHVIQRKGGGGGALKLFFQGGGVLLQSDRTCDLYWTPVPL